MYARVSVFTHGFALSQTLCVTCELYGEGACVFLCVSVDPPACPGLSAGRWTCAWIMDAYISDNSPRKCASGEMGLLLLRATHNIY